MSKQRIYPLRLTPLPVNLRKYVFRTGMSSAYQEWMFENVACRESHDNMMFVAPIPFCELANVTYTPHCERYERCPISPSIAGVWCRICLRVQVVLPST